VVAAEAARGTCSLDLAGGAIAQLSLSRVLIFPAGWRTGIAARPLPRLRIRATYRQSFGVFDHLREPLDEPLSADEPLHEAIVHLLEEIGAGRPGSRAMTEALVRRCLILFLRRYFAHCACTPPWLAAVDDVRLGRAVAAMQDRPERAFRLAELAELAGMCRSAFAARFGDALAQSPIEFLKTIRLTRAADLLAHTDVPVKAVAAKVGYSSRSSFTRAFLARHGTAPAAFRLAARSREAAISPVPLPMAVPRLRAVR
jgi:AraC-like DNA-binding protein